MVPVTCEIITIEDARDFGSASFAWLDPNTAFLLLL
jgi:hypothetical protein